MAELFANNFAVRLANGCAIGDTTIQVTAAATAALQGGQFRVVIDQEYMLVTAGQAGTTWTVTRGIEGSAPQNHASGSWVTHIWTAGGITAGVGGIPGAPGAIGPPGTNFRGAYASGSTYAAGDWVTGSDGFPYCSLAGGNIGHDPTTDGGVHWQTWVPTAVITVAGLPSLGTKISHGVLLDLSGLLDASTDGNNPGGASNAPERLVMNATLAHGSNGTRGNSITVDTGNSDGVFFAPFVVQTPGGALGTTKFNTKGSLSLITAIGVVADDGSNSYRECDGFEAAIYTQSAGAYSLGLEVLNHIYTPGAVTGAGPARASGITVVIQEDNPIGQYPTTLGADATNNTYGVSGARGIALRSTGAQAAGSAVYVDGSWVNGILFRVASSTILMQNRAFGNGNPLFQIDGIGTISWGPGSGALDVALQRTGASTMTFQGAQVIVAAGLTMFGATPAAQTATIAAAPAQTASYVQADVQAIANVANQCRTALRAIGAMA